MAGKRRRKRPALPHKAAKKGRPCKTCRKVHSASVHKSHKYGAYDKHGGWWLGKLNPLFGK